MRRCLCGCTCSVALLQDIISQATGQTGTGTGTGTGMHSGSFKETRGGPSVSSYKGT